MDQTYLSYIVTEAFLVLFTISVLLKLNIDVGTEREVRKLRYIVWSYLAMVLTDVFWAATEAEFIRPPRLLNAAINAVSLTSLALACFFWYEMVDDRLHPQRQQDKRKRFFSALLILFVIVMDLLSIFTGWVFYIDPSGHYTHGPAFVVQIVGPYVYLLVSLVEAAFFATRARTREKRREYLVYASFAIPVMVAQILSGYLTGVPVLYLCVFLMLLILFLTVQQTQISYDALTGLNNRRRLSQHFAETLTGAAPESPVTVFMMDVDRFKQINDNYGHVEGDFALQQIAKALQIVARDFGGFIARYGGDEFCYVMSGEIIDPPGIISVIRRTLACVQKECEDQKEYSIEVSIGWHVCETPGEDMEHAIGCADMMLYEDKQSRRAGR